MTKELVEEVARVIDPEIWEIHDEIRDRHDEKWFELWKSDSLETPGRWGLSIQRASALLPILARQRNEGIEAAAGVADASAKQWRNFASMGLPAMPAPYVCKIHAEKAEELATDIRALKEPE